MRILIVGAGPAGLYAGFRLKALYPDAVVHIIEQNPRDVTFGFGVVFSKEGLGFLSADDHETFRAVQTQTQSWTNIELRLGGEAIRIDGIGFSSIGRVELLHVLRRRAETAGVRIDYGRAVNEPSELEDFDLVVAADGANSRVRSWFESAFGTEISLLNNRFAWFGATRPFDALTQTFRRTSAGAFNAHHYRYASSMSTFLVETDAATFDACGLAEADEATSRLVCAEVFADVLAPGGLVSNKSIWRRFPAVLNRQWSHENIVLVGDALRTAHYSIGSGTRLALEDVQTLVQALSDCDGDLRLSFARYRELREPVVAKLLDAAARSAAWYETFAQRMDDDPWLFAMNYISRTGRIDLNRLQRNSPLFFRQFKDRHPEAVAGV